MFQTVEIIKNKALKYRYLSTLFIFIITVVFVLGINSCSTKKNTFLNRNIHQLSTHYNVWWNGNESFKDGVAELKKAINENYNKVLLVENYGTEANARKIYPQMDRAIEKAGKGIKKHSMVFKNKEYNKWIDDCYMLIGKAYFYKQDYASARRTFDFLQQNFHTSVQYEAMLWQARCYIQQKKYEEAATKLEELDALTDQPKVPFHIRREIPLVYANYFILNDNLPAAKTYLEKGVEMNTSSKRRMRLYYILAQINQKTGNMADAHDYYQKVIKGPSDYQMLFNARINLAKSFDQNTAGKGSLEKQLKKMLRDPQIKDFQDQIYYALAELARTEKNDSLFIHYLAKSVETSTKNNFQKTTSSLELATLYFGKKEYVLSQAYYDTTLQVIPNDFPNYETILSRTQNLTELVKNLIVVQEEDSLQRLAKMPEAELMQIINKKIKEYTAQEEERMRLEAEARVVVPEGSLDMMRGQNTSNIGSGEWYFYNTQAKTYGTNEFLRKWGRRKLEDNWRWSIKFQSTNIDVATEGETTEGGGSGNDQFSIEINEKGDTIKKKVEKSAAPTDLKNPQTYLAQLPKTPQALKKSNDKISNALINLGYIYKDGLNDTPSSIQSFEDWLSRFPDSPDALRIMYQLYLICKGTQDVECSQKYENQILAKGPASDYAKILENPGYNDELIAEKNRVQSLYQETYQAFSRQQYRMVLVFSEEAKKNYDDKTLLPKFEYLRALSLGKIQSMDDMVASLNSLVKEYPSSEVVPLAKELLKKYDKNAPLEPTKPGETETEARVDTLANTMFKYSPNLMHFYILVANEKTSNPSAVRIRIADFAKKSFSMEKLNTNLIVYNEENQIVVISSFPNNKAAMNFYNAVKEDDYIMSLFKDHPETFISFVISQDNYPTFYKEKGLEPYLKFFKKNYLKEK